MRTLVCLLIAFSLIVSCKSEVKPTAKIETKKITSKKMKSLNYKQLKPLLHQSGNKTYVVNFWATWCAPCVKELPAFEKLNASYKDKNVEVLLVSLDFTKQVETRLLPFIKKKNIQSKVLHFDDANEQFWIKDIAEEWTGALPATIIYNAKNRKFYEQSFDYETLENEIQTFIN